MNSAFQRCSQLHASHWHLIQAHPMFRRYFPIIQILNSSSKLRLRSTSSSFALRVPPASAPRESPTPLVFVSSRSWDEGSSNGMTTLSSMLAEKGFTCIQTELSIPQSSMKDSTTMMKDYESELLSMVRLSAIPFPPVIVARESACLIAQIYISSNPASGLVLISPPISNADLVGTRLPMELEEFNYEPNFPIAVIDTPERVIHLRDGNRICQSESEDLDIISVKDLNEEEIFVQIEQWLDKLGI